LLLQIDFEASESSSLGVEMELEIVDGETRELRGAASEILDAFRESQPEEVHAKAKHELLECTLEINTGVCTTVAEARADLEGTIAKLAALTGPRGLELMCSGTHPFSNWWDQTISPTPRYAKLIEDMQWPARQLQIFGIHVHVGVRSAAKVIAISNALSAYIPHLLALSASSPFWLGQDTGLASCRSKIFEVLPTAGLPYQMSGWIQFEEFMTTLISAQAISSIREVWWDLRPHPNFGTVEFRICDGMPTMSEVMAVAALSLCLVEWMDTLLDQGYDLECPRAWVVRENKWRAARYGIGAEIITDERGSLRPVTEAIRALVEELSPVAARMGCLDELGYVLTILDTGPSYLRQRAVAASTGSLAGVVDSLVREFATDTPITHADYPQGAPQQDSQA
jgi:glutamate---cysteine ligase / carboxylate-amine ligase